MLPRLRNTGYFPGLVDDFFYSSPWTADIESKVIPSMPTVNIREDENLYIIDVAAPGMEKQDFKIELNLNLLTISAEKKEEKDETKKKFTRREFNYSAFNRSFSLPDSVNKNGIIASYDKGILNIIVPKKEEAKESTPIQISIK